MRTERVHTTWISPVSRAFSMSDSDVLDDARDDVQNALRIELTPSFDAASKCVRAKKSKKLLAFEHYAFKYFPRWRMRQPSECIE
jgi:hypothetical protein